MIKGKEMIKVVNLTTDEEQFYSDSLTIKMAVVCAYEHDKENHNTWDYREDKARLSNSGKTVSCGDWCAVVDDEHVVDSQ